MATKTTSKNGSSAEVLTRAKATIQRAKANGEHVGGWDEDPARAEKSGAHLEALEAVAADAAKPVSKVSLPLLSLREIAIRIVGDSSLIVHKWSEKAIRLMLEKQTGKASGGREHKNPHQDYQDSLYRLPDGGYGFPTIAFKSAAVEACTSLGKTITKVAARQAFHVKGELVRIIGEPTMRQDMVRVGNETADIRFRGEFLEWETTIVVRYNTRVLSDEQIVNLFNTAGFAVGVGEWRSEKNGQHGLFHCESPR